MDLTPHSLGFLNISLKPTEFDFEVKQGEDYLLEARKKPTQLIAKSPEVKETNSDSRFRHSIARMHVRIELNRMRWTTNSMEDFVVRIFPCYNNSKY